MGELGDNEIRVYDPRNGRVPAVVYCTSALVELVNGQGSVTGWRCAMCGGD